MIKKRLLPYLLCMLIAVIPFSLLSAQTPMADIAGFNARLAHEAQTLQSIESDFIQEKYLDVFDETITSKGKFYYQKDNKICMNYSRPLDYLIVINNNELKITSEGKTNIMNLNANKMMNQMQDMLTACMVGDLSRLSADYDLAYYEEGENYLIHIKPTNANIRAYIAAIDIYIDKKNLSVNRLRLSETETNYTDYRFTNKKFNTLTDESIFKIP